MGPAQVEPPIGRGDMYEAVDWMIEKLSKDDSMNTLRARWKKLDQAEKDELM